MANHRKLGRPSDQRQALLKNQVTQLIWRGKIETTLPRALEVRSIAERLITLAVRECDNTRMVTKETNNEKGQTVTIEVKNDLPSRLNARRMVMSYVYDLPADKDKDESKRDYKERTKDIKHPVTEKLFSEIAPRLKQRMADKDAKGGYTRIVKKGPRRGDAAEMAIIEIL